MNTAVAAPRTDPATDPSRPLLADVADLLARVSRPARRPTVPLSEILPADCARERRQP